MAPDTAQIGGRWPFCACSAAAYALAMSAGVFGRDAELRMIDAFVAGLAERPGALVLAGEAGAGKTTLLRSAVEVAVARGLTVLQTAPARADLRLAFAGLADLLEPRLDEFVSALPGPQARALRIALLLDEAPSRAPEPRSISAAFRAAIGALASTSPVLVVIDDVQWLDPASAAAIGYAARRLEHERVGLLCAQRATQLGPLLPLELDRGRLQADVLPVGGLSLGALHRMLHTRLGASFAHPALRRIEAGSGGNPFIALEIGRAMLRRSAGVTTEGALPLPGTLSELVGERLGALPAEVLAALELVAVMPQASYEQYLACGTDSAALDAGVQASVLEHDGSRLAFTHPVLTAAVSAGIPPARRRQLHAAAANVAVLPEERARHRARATVGPSIEVAAELAEAAAAAAVRGAPSAAAELFELAAKLTPPTESALAGRRRLESARQLALAGDMNGARRLFEQLAETTPTGTERADALSQLALLLEHDYPAAARLMERALTEAGDDAARTADIRIALADIWSIMGDQVKATELSEQALVDAERTGEPTLISGALSQLFEHSVKYGREVDQGMLRRAFVLDPEPVLALRIPPAWAAAEYDMCCGRLEAAEEVWGQLLARAEADGVEYIRSHVLRFLSGIALLRGDARRAAELADEGLQIAEQLDVPHTVSMLLHACAWPALQLGHAQEVRELSARGLALASGTGELAHVVLHRSLPGSLDLALGDSAAAVTALRPLTGQVRAVGCRPATVMLASDAVEALVFAGELERAEEIVTELDAMMPSPLTAALAARSRGAIAAGKGDLEAAGRQFAAALRLHEQASPMPMLRGRTLLLLGMVQRRLKERGAARGTLSAALEIFEHVEAPLWAARTKAEIARISGRAPGPEDLSETERRVAELVAHGLSNREVAAELFVTVRAVESTLTKAYAKLGVRSRTELARRLRNG